MATEICMTEATGRRRLFWSNRPRDIELSECNDQCATFGMELDNSDPLGVKIKTSVDHDWVRGLIINILMTDGQREATDCGYTPGQRRGHWSDSYRADGLSSGSTVRFVQPGKSVAATVLALQAQADIDMAKLVAYGVAVRTSCAVAYLGGNGYSLTVSVVGQSGKVSNVGITGSRIGNSFVWG